MFTYIMFFLSYAKAVSIIILIRRIYKLDFKQYVRLYPISTPFFFKCYLIFQHGVVLFWAIGVIALLLSFMLLLNNSALAVCRSLSIRLVIITYFCIIIGFFLSTIYPHYITKCKIEELKLRTIKEKASERISISY